MYAWEHGLPARSCPICSSTTQGGSMVRDTARRSVLLSICFLLVCTVPGSAQSGKRRQQEPRGVNVVPATPTAASPERRVALVIGNAAYQHTAPLQNPVNDAQDIARVLRELQFQVILKTDATLDTMADAIFEFGERLKGGGVGLLYYSWPGSGHHATQDTHRGEGRDERPTGAVGEWVD